MIFVNDIKIVTQISYLKKFLNIILNFKYEYAMT